VDRVRQVQDRDKWWAAILWAGRSKVQKVRSSTKPSTPALGHTQPPIQWVP
jgi:hypothetical protein